MNSLGWTSRDSSHRKRESEKGFQRKDAKSQRGGSVSSVSLRLRVFALKMFSITRPDFLAREEVPRYVGKFRLASIAVKRSQAAGGSQHELNALEFVEPFLDDVVEH